MTPTILALLLAAGLPVPPQASQLPPWYHWLFEAFRPAGGGSGTILTVTGISPLALVNALSAPIHSLTQYGKCVQNGTPTPVAPVDILCNNGALKCSRNMLDPSTSNIFICEIVYEPGGTAASPQNWRTGFIPVVGGKTYIFYGRRKSDDLISAYNRINWYTADGTNISPRPSYTKDTPTVGTAPSNAAYVRLSCAPYNSTKPITRATFDEFNWMFAEAAQEIPYTPYAEGGIYCGGTPEVLTVSGKNIFDKSNLTRINAYIAQTGNRWTGAATGYSVRIPCRPNTTYTARYNGSGTKTVLSFGSNDNDNVPEGYGYITITQAIRKNNPTINTPITLTTSATDKWLIVAYNAKDPENADMADNLQIEIGSTATDYEPYVAPQTASVPMLLGVGDYKDAAELISGIKTGKVGVVVFDGTETNWRYTSGVFAFDNVVPAKVVVICTHFVNVDYSTSISNQPDLSVKGHSTNTTIYFKYNALTSLTDWTDWLAAQYAAGTPVIVIYPLATETTEQTTPHSLQSYNGTTIVTAQTNVDPVTLRAEYKGVVT